MNNLQQAPCVLMRCPSLVRGVELGVLLAVLLLRLDNRVVDRGPFWARDWHINFRCRQQELALHPIPLPPIL